MQVWVWRGVVCRVADGIRVGCRRCAVQLVCWRGRSRHNDRAVADNRRPAAAAGPQLH